MLWCVISSATYATGLSDINADDVLNSQCKDSACTAQAKNPDQTRYYTTSNDHLGEAQIAADTALADAGKQQLTASDFKAQANHRKATAEVPDLTDPALMRLGDFVQHSPTLMNGISDKYHDCTGGVRYQYATQTRQCFRATNNAITTTMSRVHTGNTTQTRTVIVHGFSSQNTLPAGATLISVVFIKANGQPAPTILNSWGQRVTYKITVPVTGWKTNRHDTQLRAAGCSPRSLVCSEPHETRTIAGVPVTEACWEKTQTWQCPSQNTCQTLPISPLDKMHMSAGQTSCQRQGQACQTRIQGVCIAQRETYRCTTKTQKDDELVCGAPGSVVCPPNSPKPECQPPRYTTNTSMVEALKGLALQKAITDEFDPKSLTFFSGDAKMCAKGALGTFDCCSSHEGWAGKIGAHSCDADAREIAAAKSKHIAIKVGTFCAKKVLGACLRKKESYCLYSSKVARIATTGALAQIGKRLGSAEHPECRGLTQEDFATLDFSKMDFSELASDMKTPTLPNTDALQSKFKDFDSSTFENHP